jgi:hypothetical protein
MRRILLLALAGLAPVILCGADKPTPNPDEQEGTISGMPIQRGQGWIGIELDDNTFKMTFYNAKKKPVAADASSAVLWWPVHYQPNPERTELVPTGDPAVLASSYSVKPPHTFILHITLLFTGKPDTTESYVVNFSQ